MTFIDFFAGIGGFRRGMELAGYECVGFCEFDKYATMSYVAMHLLTDEQREYLKNIPSPPKKNGERNLNKRQKEISKEEYINEWYANDIRTVRAADIPKSDCWCFGFPCQDISVAGKQTGFKGNRSSLFFAVTRLIRELEEEDRPTYLFIENVKNLLSVNRGWDFTKLLIELDEIGYDAEWQVINSKYHGVPQSRERIFIIGHLRGRSTSKVFPIERADGENSIQRIGKMTTSENVPQSMRIYSQNSISPSLDTCGGGNLQPKVAMPIFCDLTNDGDFTTSENARCLQARYNKGVSNHKGETSGVAIPIKIIDFYNKKIKDDGICGTLTSNTGASTTHCGSFGLCIPVLNSDRENKRQNGRRFKEDGEPMFTLTSQDRHGVMVDVSDGIKIKEATKKGYAVADIGDSVNLSVPNSKTRRGRVGKGVANTLDTGCNQGVIVQTSEELTVYAVWVEKYNCYMAIRKLTPKECFRLQGWEDTYFERAALVNSDSQLYKQAGNGVTVPVIYEIAKRIHLIP